MIMGIKILAIDSHNGDGANYKERNINIDIPDQWAALDTPAKEPMQKLLVHFLQVHWGEQYLNCVNKKQTAIDGKTLRSATIDSIKAAINHDACCDDLKKLSENVISANTKVQQEIKVARDKWVAEHPIDSDECCGKEWPLVSSGSSRGFWAPARPSETVASADNTLRNKTIPKV